MSSVADRFEGSEGLSLSIFLLILYQKNSIIITENEMKDKVHDI